MAQVDPMDVLKQGYQYSVAIAGVGIVFLCRILLYTSEYPSAWMNFAGCGLLGLGTAFLFILCYAVLYRFCFSTSSLDCTGKLDRAWHECHRRHGCRHARNCS